LADGTSFSQAAQVSKNGQWPLFVPLYRGQGAIFAWINFGDTGSNDLSGDLTWSKPVSPNAKYYPAGFTMQQSVAGSHYAPPARGETVLNLTDANLMLAGGGLDQPVDNQVTLNANNKVGNSSSNKMSLGFSVGTGLFSGHVIDPGTSRSISFRGVVLQTQNMAAGYFLNPSADESGQVTLGP
jgi:hypothetical protein